MFGTIRRHQTWLWAVIVTITVVSFVVFFNPSAKYAGRGGGSARLNLGSIDGEPVTRDAYIAARDEAQLFYFLNHGDGPDRDTDAKRMGYDEQREVYQRLFLLKKCGVLNIHVSREAVGRMAAQILHSMGRNGEAVPLDAFEKQILQPRGLTTGDFQRFLEHNLAVQELVAALGQSGKLTTPQEAELLYRREHEEIFTEAVFFSATNFLDRVTVTPEALGQFFTNQMARYRVPDRRQVSYVKFNEKDFVAEADQKMAALTNLDAQIEAIYQQRGTNYYHDKTPVAAKTEIREDYRRELALRAARAKASAFADELLNQTPAQAGSLVAFAVQSNLTAEVSAPFDAETGPVELNVPPLFAKSAFKLTDEEPFAGPIMAEDGVYVIALKKQIPSEVPVFDSIRAQVTADYQLILALQLARQAGTNFATAVAVGLPAKTFAALCAEAKVEAVKLPGFSLSTRSLPEVENHVAFGRLQDIVFGVPAGSATGFVPTSDGGVVVHVISRSPVSEAKVKAELPAFLAQVRQTRQSEAFQAWFAREAQTGLRDTPLAHPAK